MLCAILINIVVCISGVCSQLKVHVGPHSVEVFENKTCGRIMVPAASFPSGDSEIESVVINHAKPFGKQNEREGKPC